MISRPWRYAHAIWLTLAACLSGFVIAFGGEGHPPGILLLPAVAVAWIAGHVGMWCVARLAASGRRAAASFEAPWPIVLWVGLLGTGLGGSLGVLQLAVTAVLRELYPYRYPALWTTMAFVWLAHGVCFVGLLLRRSWSRLLLVAVAIVWALLGVRQIREHLVGGGRIEVVELAILVAIVLALLAFAIALVRSQRVQAFLATPSPTKR